MKYNVLFLVVAATLWASLLSAGDLLGRQQKQIDMFKDLGLLKYSGKLDASGSQQIFVLGEKTPGVYDYDYVTETDGSIFEQILEKRGIIKMQVNRETGETEKHILIFNPRDKRGHDKVWVPVTRMRETLDRIRTTGDTLPGYSQPHRINEKALKDNMDFGLSF